MTDTSGRTPVLSPDGLRYCSPHCGMGCTKAEHDAAQAKAAALAETLGDGWEPVVWENWGWNWKARKGCCEIYGSRRNDDYTIYLNLPGYDGLLMQIILSGSDPAELLGLAKQDARTSIARMEAALAEI